MIDFKIISTGSKGNAVIIGGEILIDAGVPFKALRADYKRLKLVLLTHIHQDHFNRSTVRTLAQERPTLRFGCCEWMAGPLVECGVDKRNIDVYNPGYCFIYPDFCTVTTNMTIHNVPNCAYHIWAGQESLFYATDTNSLDGIEAENYTLYMVEANYTEEEIIERIRRKQAAGEFCHEYAALDHHLSREKADNWLYQNMGPNSRYVYLHEHEERALA